MRRIVTALALLFAATSRGENLVLTDEFYHVRNAEPREWSHFPEEAERTELNLRFGLPNPADWKTLTLRQAETKQLWVVTLNGKRIGRLDRDHNDQLAALEIPPNVLRKTENELRIHTESEKPDDAQFGEVELHTETRAELTSGFDISAQVIDEAGKPLPCRFTITETESGTLALLSAKSDDRQAVRTGVVYALDGNLSVSLRPGKSYRVQIGRGFEYELLNFNAEELKTIPTAATEPILLRRVIRTPNLVACDTHLHTLQFARHGDCNLTERLISIAGEGIELPISTEHEQHIDYAPEAKRIGADRFFTPVVGCEVTTSEGHFNSFPIDPSVNPAEHKLRPWKEVFRNIFGTGARICIINHPRDVHRNFTPFDPGRWDLKTGRFTDGRKLEANGFELINSGATQTDPMQLAHDWMALLRSGHRIAAVGSSDSHTVNFAIPGQGRTYIEMPDADPANLNIDAAVEAILAGKTHVCFGLLVTLNFENGQLQAMVQRPNWIQADSLALFKNGGEIMSVPVPKSKTVSHTGINLEIPDAQPGDFYVAIAKGPGITEAHWTMMPPYQPDSPDFEPYVFGVSPAVFPKGRKK